MIQRVGRIENIFLLIAVASLVSCGSGGEGGDEDDATGGGSSVTFSVSGTILNSSDPATINIVGPDSRAVQSDRNGTFRIRSLPAGSYSLFVSQSGYEFTPSKVDVVITDSDVEAGSFTRVDLQRFSVFGSVTNHSGSSTVRMNGPISKSVPVAGDGSFRISDLVSGSYSLVIGQAGFLFEPPSKQIVIVDGDVDAGTFTRLPPEDALSSEELIYLEALPDESPPESDSLLPNGQTLTEFAGNLAPSVLLQSIPAPSAESEDQSNPPKAAQTDTGAVKSKDSLVFEMILSARKYSCGRHPNNPCPSGLWSFPADPRDPERWPRQEILTYEWGGKDPNTRTIPEGDDWCFQETYGLDCSGLIFNIAKDVGISLPKGTAKSQSHPTVWGFPSDSGLEMRTVTDGSTEPGDIVFWANEKGHIYHVGIVEVSKSTGEKTFISSTGGPADCLKNITPPQGPRSIPVAGFKRDGTLPIKVLRIQQKKQFWSGSYQGTECNTERWRGSAQMCPYYLNYLGWWPLGGSLSFRTGTSEPRNMRRSMFTPGSNLEVCDAYTYNVSLGIGDSFVYNMGDFGGPSVPDSCGKDPRQKLATFVVTEKIGSYYVSGTFEASGICYPAYDEMGNDIWRGDGSLMGTWRAGVSNSPFPKCEYPDDGLHGVCGANNLHYYGSTGQNGELLSCDFGNLSPGEWAD